jgi:hypothetical protein
VELWDFRFRGFEDLKIKPTGNMTLTCTYYITDSAMIHVMPGGKMFVSPTGTILNRCGCHGNTYKIEGLMEYAALCSPPANTTLQILPGGTLSAQQFCFQNGVKFQIFPGGKVLLNNVDYTNEIQNYTQVNVNLSNQTVNQNIYAMQDIMAISNVQTSGPVLFKAGNKIVLQDGFKGTDGFTATIDPNVSYCSQSSCVESYHERMNYTPSTPQPQHNPFNTDLSNNSHNLNEIIKQIPESLLVYPNITSGWVALNVNKENITINEIMVYDITGKMVRAIHREDTPSLNLVNLTELENGIYILSAFTSSGNIHHIKVILRK